MRLPGPAAGTVSTAAFFCRTNVKRSAGVMARPTKQTEERREHVVAFRVTPEEHARLSGKAREADLPLSTFARVAALRAKVVAARGAQAPCPPLPVGVLAELHRIGVNLNQLTRVANTAGRCPKAVEPLLGRIAEILDAAMASADDVEDVEGTGPPDPLNAAMEGAIAPGTAGAVKEA